MASVTGGDNLDRALRDLAKRLAKPATLRVGFLEGATYPDGTSVALVAAAQNYGAPAAGIPPRPFFSNMVRDNADEWGPELAGLMAQEGMTIERALGLMGERIKGQLQQAIRDTVDPPLKPATIKRKGFAKPLIDTSQMINSAAYEVET